MGYHLVDADVIVVVSILLLIELELRMKVLLHVARVLSQVVWGKLHSSLKGVECKIECVEEPCNLIIALAVRVASGVAVENLHREGLPKCLICVLVLDPIVFKALLYLWAQKVLGISFLKVPSAGEVLKSAVAKRLVPLNVLFRRRVGLDSFVEVSQYFNVVH